MKIALAIIILAALGIGGYFLINAGNEDSAENQTQTTVNNAEDESTHEDELATETQTISYDGVNFAPKQITVHQGTTVVFTNNSEKDMWVASDVHPTHEELPGFDSLSGVGPGETYSYAFERAGSWGFHDHLNPTATGTVIVEE